jgi:hypothetical protein
MAAMGSTDKRAATYDDAHLLLRLYELRREEKMRTARNWFMKNFRAGTLDEFQDLCPLGTEENAYYRMVVSYWEMGGDVCRHGRSASRAVCTELPRAGSRLGADSRHRAGRARRIQECESRQEH